MTTPTPIKKKCPKFCSALGIRGGGEIFCDVLLVEKGWTTMLSALLLPKISL